MSRRTERAASQAAVDASEAARTLAARSHEARAEKTEPQAEQETERGKISTPQDKMEKLLANRTHNKVMDSIIERREPEAKEEPKAEPQAKPEAPAVSEAQPEAQPEAPKTVRVKVDGEEFDAPQDEVDAAGGVKAFQIMKAAEKRLEMANKTLAEAKKYQVDLGQLAQALRQPQEPAKPKESDAEFIASRMDIIRFGTPQEAAQAQLEINQRLAPKVDPDALTMRAVAVMEHQNAVRQFDKEFQDVVTNPLLLKLVVALREEGIRKHQIENPNKPIDWNSFYSTIGNQVRSLAPGRHHQPASTTPQTQGTTSQPSDKEARKASIVNLPTTAARAEGPKEEKPLTPEEERKQAIAELRNQRRAQG